MGKICFKRRDATYFKKRHIKIIYKKENIKNGNKIPKKYTARLSKKMPKQTKNQLKELLKVIKKGIY